MPLSYLEPSLGEQVHLYIRDTWWHLLRYELPNLVYPPMQVVDTTPPETAMVIGAPKHEGVAATWASGSTGFALWVDDEVSGVEDTRFRVDGGHVGNLCLSSQPLSLF